MSRARLVWVSVLVVVLGGAAWWQATSTETRLFALDSESGRIVWSAGLPANTRRFGSPVARDDLVVIQSTVTDPFGSVERYWQATAYDHQSGRERWRYAHPANPLQHHITSPIQLLIPHLTDQRVLIGDPETGDAGITLVALDAQTGQLVWTLDDVAFGDNSRHVDVAGASGKVFTPIRDGETLWLLALDERDGTVLWRSPLGAPQLPDSGIGPFFAATADAVFVGTTTALVALDAANGAERFRLEAPDPIRSGGIALEDGVLIWGTDFNTFTAYDAVTGAQRWRFRQPFDPIGGWFRAFSARHGLLVATCACDRARILDNGWLLGIDVVSGQERWRVPLGDTWNVQDLPAVSAQTVLTGGELRQDVTARSAADGSARWHLPRRLGSNVATDGGSTIYAADRDARWRHWLTLLGIAR
jgi:outer membrane protein assembly factor BamB